MTEIAALTTLILPLPLAVRKRMATIASNTGPIVSSVAYAIKMALMYVRFTCYGNNSPLTASYSELLLYFSLMPYIVCGSSPRRRRKARRITLLRCTTSQRRRASQLAKFSAYHRSDSLFPELIRISQCPTQHVFDGLLSFPFLRPRPCFRPGRTPSGRGRGFAPSPRQGNSKR